MHAVNLLVPNTRQHTFASRLFSVSGPLMWNVDNVHDIIQEKLKSYISAYLRVKT